MQNQFTKKQTLAVKGLAIILLLTYHLFENEHLVTGLNVIYAPFALDDFLMITGFGNICVAIFVFLTAFGITRSILVEDSIDSKEIYRRATKRFFRLMLNFAILYISVNLLWWYKFDYNSLYGGGKQGILNVLCDATGLAMFFDTPTLNMTWWYMEIAYVLIFVVPLFALLVRKIGYPIIFVAFLAPAVVSVHPDIERYLFTAVLGTCAAYGNWPGRWMQEKRYAVLQWLFVPVGFILCILIRQNALVQESYVHVVDGIVAMYIVWMAGVMLHAVPLVSACLKLVGKHAMNIYLVHTFFYMALWQQYIYWFKYPIVILLVLLAVCLVYSVILEGIKKALTKLTGKILKNIKKSA